MVNFQKWIIIAAGLVFLGLFTQEAAATGLTGTLKRTGLSGASIGSGIQQAGTGAGAGIAGFFRGILSPFWEIRNIVRGFMNLGSATPWLEDNEKADAAIGGGGGTGDTTSEGGGAFPIPTSIIQGTPDVYATSGGFDYYSNPSISPVPITDATVSFGSGDVDLPLSAEAVQWYKDHGIVVTPTEEDGGGTNDYTGGGGGSASRWVSNARTPTGGVASGNISLAGWA